MKRILLVLTLIFVLVSQIYCEVVPGKTVKPMARETIFDDTAEGVLVYPEKESIIDQPRVKKPKEPEVIEREDVIYVEPRGPVTRAADTILDSADDAAFVAGDVAEAAAEVPARVLGIL